MAKSAAITNAPKKAASKTSKPHGGGLKRREEAYRAGMEYD